MATAENSRKGRKVRQRMIASAILILATGFSAMAYAQDESQAASADMQDFRLGENQHHPGSPIEGSWIFNIDLKDLGNQEITFSSLISFTAGGVVVTSASLPTPSPFYGSWRRTGPKSFNAVFYAFAPDPITGIPGTLKQNLKLNLTSLNQLSVTGVGYSCDLQGENCVQTNSSTSTGKRIPAE